MMPREVLGQDEYPTRDATIAYLASYEQRYALPVERSVHVHAVARTDAGFELDTSAGIVRACRRECDRDVELPRRTGSI